ncbi:hypothetical protein CDAR_603811 [Caerostris darwini]|uniref:Uncharacterized protein n=1 Tax=Caerostris darwini TaxID=1538125 RepID=A0AAV4T3C4_9ARAC|nr:hypothetical protein CDAR_603811 [Caerostris darwini]
MINHPPPFYASIHDRRKSTRIQCALQGSKTRKLEEGDEVFAPMEWLGPFHHFPTPLIAGAGARALEWGVLPEQTALRCGGRARLTFLQGPNPPSSSVPEPKLKAKQNGRWLTGGRGERTDGGPSPL